MARKKKDTIEQNDIQIKEQVKEQITEQENKDKKQDIIIPDIVIRDTRTIEQKLNSFKRKLRRI